jgi:hypothetical protein
VEFDMNGGTHFRAPMSTKLRIFTAIFIALMGVVLFTAPPPANFGVLAILGLTAAFSVRGYTVQPGMLLVHRLGWATKIPLNALVSADAEPNATVGSIRVFGIGGAFAFAGKFRNATLGSYRAYVTDPSFCVVLDLGSETVVVTPDSPVRFVEAVLLAARGRT